jgi:plasmid stability protein
MSHHLGMFLGAHGAEGPWPCCFCKEDITVGPSHRGADSLCVHHIDGQHHNNAPDNLTSAHRGCHSKHHNAGKKMAPEVRERIRATLKGRQMTPEHRAKISAGLKGRRFTDESRAKMSAAQQRRAVSTRGVPLSPEHRAKISAGRMGHEVTAETRAKLSAALKGKPAPWVAEANKRRMERREEDNAA